MNSGRRWIIYVRATREVYQKKIEGVRCIRSERNLGNGLTKLSRAPEPESSLESGLLMNLIEQQVVIGHMSSNDKIGNKGPVRTSGNSEIQLIVD